MVLSATATWLGLARQKNLDVLREIAVLGQMRGALEKKIRGTVQTRRPYAAVRADQDTRIITLILPADMAEFLEIFATAKNVSKNDLCSNLLTKGLILHLTAKQRLLKALQYQREQTKHPPAIIKT